MTSGNPTASSELHKIPTFVPDQNPLKAVLVRSDLRSEALGLISQDFAERYER